MDNPLEMMTAQLNRVICERDAAHLTIQEHVNNSLAFRTEVLSLSRQINELTNTLNAKDAKIKELEDELNQQTELKAAPQAQDVAVNQEDGA